MIPSDRLFCAFVEPMHVRDMFTQWPLHITIIPWFRTDISTDDFARTLSQRLSPLQPFQVIVNGETRMGHNKTVNLLKMPSPIENIAHQARKLLHEKDSWIVDETTKKHRDFRPHITAQKDTRVHEGDRLICDSLYIIEQKGDHKEVVSRIEL
jgi:2'-5' RNA ligase